MQEHGAEDTGDQCGLVTLGLLGYRGGQLTSAFEIIYPVETGNLRWYLAPECLVW